MAPPPAAMALTKRSSACRIRKGADHHDDRKYHSEDQKGHPPPQRGNQLGAQSAQQHSSEAESHQSHSGNKSLLIRKPTDGQADGGIISQSYTEAAEHTVTQVDSHQTVNARGCGKTDEQAGGTAA